MVYFLVCFEKIVLGVINRFFFLGSFQVRLKCLQQADTTYPDKALVHGAVSARPRRQMTAGTVMSSHHQVRLKATCNTLLNLYSEKSAESFCIQDTIFIGHMHLDVEFV